MVPLSRWYVKICIVESKTPFLISNNVFRTLGAQIDTASDHVHFSKLDLRMPLSLSEKKLYLLDFCELIRMGNHIEHISQKEHGEYPIMISDTKVGTFDGCRSSENSHDQVDSSSARPNLEQCNSQFSGSDSEVTVRSNVRDAIDSQHGHLQPRRSAPSSDQSKETGRVPEDVVRPARPDAGVVRRIQVNQTFQEVVETDPKYVQWFIRKYGDSQKASHQPFLYFVNLYVERLELMQEKSPKGTHELPTMCLKAKSKTKKPIDLESEEGWSEPESGKPWSVVQEENSIIQVELITQKERISNMESSLSQIAQQLQNLTQLTMQNLQGQPC